MATKKKKTNTAKPVSPNDFVIDGQTGELHPRKRTVPVENLKPKPEPMPGH